MVSETGHVFNPAPHSHELREVKVEPDLRSPTGCLQVRNSAAEIPPRPSLRQKPPTYDGLEADEPDLLPTTEEWPHSPVAEPQPPRVPAAPHRPRRATRAHTDCPFCCRLGSPATMVTQDEADNLSGGGPGELGEVVIVNS
ncbi:UNVERIFIED_CONTAM: hypothetical protein FKN15_016708 [Acipenser sinensis]